MHPQENTAEAKPINSVPLASSVSLDDFLSLDNFQKKHADKFTRTSLNWLLRFRDRNGLAASGAVIMVNRKFFLHESRFAAWFNNQRA